MNVCTIPLTPMTGMPLEAEERAYIYPGELWVARVPTSINAVLGSSVSVCLWSPTVAGMNHYILPRGGDQKSSRYGNHALAMLLERMLQLGAEKSEILAAVFGGAAILGPSLGGDLARRNVTEAYEFLSRHAIPILRKDVGGLEGRKLSFRTVDGSTFVRKL